MDDVTLQWPYDLSDKFGKGWKDGEASRWWVNLQRDLDGLTDGEVCETIKSREIADVNFPHFEGGYLMLRAWVRVLRSEQRCKHEHDASMGELEQMIRDANSPDQIWYVICRGPTEKDCASLEQFAGNVKGFARNDASKDARCTHLLADLMAIQEARGEEPQAVMRNVTDEIKTRPIDE